MKILALDVETAPNLVHVWGLWQQNVGLPQIIDSGYVMCWAAKWIGDDDIMFDSIHISSSKRMLRRIHQLLDEADVVLHWNGSKFDIPTLNKEFVLHGMTPPAPYKQIDLLKTSRSSFKFPSNKLDYVAQALRLGKKLHNRGHELWIACMKGDDAAWEEMEKYNKQDVLLLEKLYVHFKPWIKNHPHMQLYTGQVGCPVCGFDKLQKRGMCYTSARKYQRYRCNKCGSWSRSLVQIGSSRKLQQV